MEHTQELWETFRQGQQFVIESGAVRIAIVDTGEMNAGLGSGEGEANARRIVACVNACQRIPTDLLERLVRGANKGIHPVPQEKIEALQSDRDELLAALEKIAGFDLTDENAMVEVAKAAIAKAEATHG